MLALLGTATAAGGWHSVASAQGRDGFGRNAPIERSSPHRGAEPADRRVAAESDFLLIAAKADLARGDAAEARRKLDTLIARFPAEPAAAEAGQLLLQLRSNAPAAPGRDSAAAAPSLSVDRLQRPPATPDRAAALDGRRLTKLQQDFRGTIGDRVFFGEASAEIGTKSRSVLAAQAEWLKRHGALVLTIEGHADDRGTAEFNREVSERRAQSVRARLIAEGISPDRIRVLALGRERQVAPCNEVGCAAQNRRVITVISDRTGSTTESRGADFPPPGYTRTRGN